ncbi:MAG: hypothetical protein MUF31_11565, partial [Akkermansiaceae bacterium]|nr:hypothetical protein [Akkermansiaceae bacterium]
MEGWCRVQSMSMYRLCLLFLGLMATLVLPSCRGGAAEVKVSDLASLIREAAGDGRTIRMTPGTYRLSDIENDQSIEARRKAKDFVLMAI